MGVFGKNHLPAAVWLVFWFWPFRRLGISFAYNLRFTGGLQKRSKRAQGWPLRGRGPIYSLRDAGRGPNVDGVPNKPAQDGKRRPKVLRHVRQKRLHEKTHRAAARLSFLGASWSLRRINRLWLQRRSFFQNCFRPLGRINRTVAVTKTCRAAAGACFFIKHVVFPQRQLDFERGRRQRDRFWEPFSEPLFHKIGQESGLRAF